MDFAKKQLEKYGWKEGQGLGKHENGISVALKPKLKFDTSGVGHDSSEQFTNNWWEGLYNKACSNIKVKEEDGSVKVKVKVPDAVEISTKNYSVKNFNSSRSGLEYGSFLKTSKLTPTGMVDLGNNFHNNNEEYDFHKLTDEQLFAACGKRTAHKGARHGIELNGKLSRIEKQEKLLLKQLKRISLSDDRNSKLEKKLKKIADHKARHSIDAVEEDSLVLDLPSGDKCILGSPNSQKCKKRKKERKRVSFNETVTEYQTQATDEETKPESSLQNNNVCPNSPVVTVRLSKIKEDKRANNGIVSSTDADEGIDCTNYDEAKDSLKDKVRKEHKQMKRRLKKLRNSKHASEPNHSDNSCTKRKLFKEFEDCDAAELQFKKIHVEVDPKEKKLILKQLKKQKRLNKQVNMVADSLDQFCKI